MTIPKTNEFIQEYLYIEEPMFIEELPPIPVVELGEAKEEDTKRGFCVIDLGNEEE